MFEVTVVSVVLGLVAGISSMVMLAMILRSNVHRPGGFVGAAFGSGGRDYVRWYEARTMMYLKISISDFLTLFSARTRVWFWERRPGYALGSAALVATFASTMLSLFWDDTAMAKAEESYMVGLQHSKFACLSVWIFCIIWFLIQDVTKVATYHVLEALAKAGVSGDALSLSSIFGFRTNEAMRLALSRAPRPSTSRSRGGGVAAAVEGMTPNPLNRVPSSGGMSPPAAAAAAGHGHGAGASAHSALAFAHPARAGHAHSHGHGHGHGGHAHGGLTLATTASAAKLAIKAADAPGAGPTVIDFPPAPSSSSIRAVPLFAVAASEDSDPQPIATPAPSVSYITAAPVPAVATAAAAAAPGTTVVELVPAVSGVRAPPLFAVVPVSSPPAV